MTIPIDTKPRPPDLEKDRFLLVQGGALPGPVSPCRLVWPFMNNAIIVHTLSVSGLAKLQEAKTEGQPLYPRGSMFRVMGDINVGTIDELCAKYRTGLTNALRQSLLIDADPQYEELRQQAWAGHQRWQQMFADAGILAEDGKKPRNTVLGSDLVMCYGTPEYNEKFGDLRREMEKDNPCPLSDAHRDLVEGLVLLGLGREGTNGMDARQVGEMFIKYADWKEGFSRDYLCERVKAFYRQHNREPTRVYLTEKQTDLVLSWCPRQEGDEKPARNGLTVLGIPITPDAPAFKLE